MRVGVRHQLVRLLRGTVQANRVIDVVANPERKARVGAAR